MTVPPIAAIICTHNRDTYLGAAIDSLLAQEQEDYEVIVVNNRSTDGTQEVISAYQDHPKFKAVDEPVLGLSSARNRGAKEAQASILAYLDDDAVASPQWLKVLVNAFANQEKLAIAGGRVTLIWPEDRSCPPWLSENLTQALGFYNLGDKVLNIQEPGLTPRGLNYSIRRDFLEQVGGFDTNLGRVGKNLLSNEELFMTELALSKGWQVAYLPEALVAHNVAPERLHPAWFLNRSWWQGVSECYREVVSGRQGIGQMGRGAERFIRGTYKTLKYLGNPSLCFDNFAYTYGQIGYLRSAIAEALFHNHSHS